MFTCYSTMLLTLLLRLRAKAYYAFIIFVFICVMTFFTVYCFSVIDQKCTPQKKVRFKILPNFDVIDDVITILEWTDPTAHPFPILKQGRDAFLNAGCKYKNCFVTSDKSYLPSVELFDAIIFNAKSITEIRPHQLPQLRQQRQKYIFSSMESSYFYPVCYEYWENYFNWTFTYKIDSDLRWGYFTVYDLKDNIIGPKINMNWPQQMDPVNEEVLKMLKTKSQAAAWFVSNCNYVPNGRKQFVQRLQVELEKYGLFVDIYGHCGRFKCPSESAQYCFDLIKNNYYFYLSFENSFAEDYVTEKLITALNNYAVPVVYGAANYSRFLPPGSYLNAGELGVQKLAETMNDVIKNRTLYHDFFRWRNHFKYKEITETDYVCAVCEMLNNKEKVNQVSIAKNLRSWWNGAYGACKNKFSSEEFNF